MNNEQFNALVIQALEHERGGIQVYETALRCVINEDLQEEWEKYLGETREHERKLRELCETLGIDPEKKDPGRAIVKHVGGSLVEAMEKALATGDGEVAQLVACECIVLAETKDHLNWNLLGMCAEKLKGKAKEAVEAACEEVEDQEDEHLYHTTGWCRELWLKSLGLKAVLPPPEERKDVKSAIGAARAAASRAKMR